MPGIIRVAFYLPVNEILADKKNANRVTRSLHIDVCFKDSSNNRRIEEVHPPSAWPVQTQHLILNADHNGLSRLYVKQWSWLDRSLPGSDEILLTSWKFEKSFVILYDILFPNKAELSLSTTVSFSLLTMAIDNIKPWQMSRRMTKPTKWRAPNEDSDQPGHPPSLIRVFTVHKKKASVLSYPLSAQQRLWSDWADAQANLSLRCAHRSFCWFVMRKLKCQISSVS